MPGLAMVSRARFVAVGTRNRMHERGSAGAAPLEGNTTPEVPMKIDDLDVTLFAWDDIPPTTYTAGAQNRSGRSSLGLVRIRTDGGIDGHAFLGSATNPAETDAASLIRFLKPILLGSDP